MRTHPLHRRLQGATITRSALIALFATLGLLLSPVASAGPGPEHGGETEEDLSASGDLPQVDADDDPVEAGAQAEPEAKTKPEPEAKPKLAKASPKKRSSSKKKKKTHSKSRSAPKTPRPKKSKLCAYRTPLHEHVVAEGEHLGSIAGRYGVMRKDLVELNPELKNPDLIRPGQTVKVCPELAPRNRKRVVYEVQPGDNLLTIAKTHELSLDELLAQQADPVSNPDLIRAGQKLVIEVDGDIVPGFEPEVARSYDRGSLHSSHRLPKGIGYAIKRPHLAYGTERTVSMIKNVIDRYHRRANGGPLVHVGDISRKGGGPLKGHVSHQRGVDVDVGLVLKGEQRNDLRFHKANEKNLDVRRTWLLVHEFLKTGQVRYIFLDYRVQKQLYEYAKKTGVSEAELDEYFQYPRGRGRNYGIVRHWKGHRDHIHVRFRR
jgi:LysM repeat protein